MKGILVGVVAFTIMYGTCALAVYNPNTGRWLSRDPVGEPGFELASGRPLAGQEEPARNPIGKEGGRSLYGFVDNNPQHRFDPLGLTAWFVCKKGSECMTVGDTKTVTEDRRTWYTLWLCTKKVDVKYRCAYDATRGGVCYWKEE